MVAEGKTVVSVLHEISMALHADDIVVMAQGRVTHQGACADPDTHRALEAVFDQRCRGSGWLCPLQKLRRNRRCCRR